MSNGQNQQILEAAVFRNQNVLCAVSLCAVLSDQRLSVPITVTIIGAAAADMVVIKKAFDRAQAFLLKILHSISCGAHSCLLHVGLQIRRQLLWLCILL